VGPFSPYITAGVAGFNIETKFGDATDAEDDGDTEFAVNLF
jgi:hypothetical protein